MALIKPVKGISPTFGKNCFIAENATIVGDVVTLVGPLAPHHGARVFQVNAVVQFLAVDRKRQRPVLLVFDGIHELGGDQQRQVELAQAAVLALGTNKIHDIRMADIKRRHLRTTTTTGR